jgi:SPP1 family predicted phage head-tail adaptor
MERNGKFDAFSRRFIHRNNGGLWASARDLSLKERMGANSKDIENTIIFEVNYNEKIIIRWQDLFILFNNRTYKITAKPDEFDYTQNKGSIKIQATQCEDNNHYEQEQYEV